MLIVSFSGRKGCGKSTAADYLVENYGFQKISFADPLKKLLSKVLDTPLDNFYSQQHKEAHTIIEWGPTHTDRLSEQCGEHIPHTKDYTFYSIREALQVVGTDILRAHDPDFHVKRALVELAPEGKYCADDCRFPNEMLWLKNNGAKCVFLLRPNNFEYSNHYSEVALNWAMFEYNIINNRSVKYLQNKLKSFMLGVLNPNHAVKRDALLDLLQNNKWDTTQAANKWGCSRDKIVWWANVHLIDLKKREYAYDDTAFIYPSAESSYVAGLISADGCLKCSGRSVGSYVLSLSSSDVELVHKFARFIKTNKGYNVKYRAADIIPNKITTQYELVCNSQYVVENIKLWNIEPRKSKNNKVPEIIADNYDLLRAWLIGLIDGDGSIHYSTNKYGCENIHIGVLSSQAISELIVNTFPAYKFTIERDHKKIEGLYNTKLAGQSAINWAADLREGFYNIGLPRKWERIDKFIESRATYHNDKSTTRYLVDLETRRATPVWQVTAK